MTNATSPPSRAAWIEICRREAMTSSSSRRLHGRRGLKYFDNPFKVFRYVVAAFTGGVD